MRFWDSSAVVPLVTREWQSSRCRAWLREDSTMLVWALAATEVVSALVRKRREAVLKPQALTTARTRLARLESAWHEVVEYEVVRARARRLLELHPLRAADALHLGAALVAAEETPSRMAFVTFDGRLAEAAEREGFRVLRA